MNTNHEKKQYSYSKSLEIIVQQFILKAITNILSTLDPDEVERNCQYQESDTFNFNESLKHHSDPKKFVAMRPSRPLPSKLNHSRRNQTVAVKHTGNHYEVLARGRASSLESKIPSADEFVELGCTGDANAALAWLCNGHGSFLNAKNSGVSRA